MQRDVLLQNGCLALPSRSAGPLGSPAGAGQPGQGAASLWEAPVVFCSKGSAGVPGDSFWCIPAQGHMASSLICARAEAGRCCCFQLAGNLFCGEVTQKNKLCAKDKQAANKG